MSAEHDITAADRQNPELAESSSDAAEVRVFEQHDHPTRLGEELRALLTLAIPVVLSELGWMTMTIVDLIMVGRLGPDSIGAVGLGNAIYYAPSLFGIGILLGLDTLVAQSWGAGRYDDCHRSLAQGIYIAVATTPVLMLFMLAAQWIFTGRGVDPTVASLTRAYVNVLNWGTLPLLLYGGFRRYLQGVGRVRPVAFALITANLINLAGNWILIYGHCGFPALGVRGSALSTCAARVYMAGVLIYAAWAHESKRGHALFAHWPAPDWTRIRALLALGLPAASQVVLEVAAFGAATVMAAHLNPIALATHEIVLSCAAYTYMVPLGISAAAAVAVGHAIGAGNAARARRAGLLAIGLGAGFMACMALLLITFPRPILRIWTSDGQVLALGAHILAIVAGFQIFDGIQSVSTGALRGLGETRFPMLMNLTGYWILGLPLGALLCFVFHWGLSGLWLGLTLALIVIALLLCVRWLRDSRQPLRPASVN
ncbi:MAG TPA: MATE family efflux transporter [Acidobacteriaceae bacterium]|jgi:MATE family multidrug resistance protein|nr:MATE family efflux transporter [Acidobacteriaceae bacterium]